VKHKARSVPVVAKRPSALTRFGFRVLGAVHGFAYRRGMARSFGNMQQVLLTTTGRKSGKPQTVALGAMPEAGGWVVIGSFGGADVHPNWWLNLLANPRASIQLNDQRIDVRMEEISNPDDYQRLWNAVVSKNPGYAGYSRKTSRHIPLGLLRPADKG